LGKRIDWQFKVGNWGRRVVYERRRWREREMGGRGAEGGFGGGDSTRVRTAPA